MGRADPDSEISRILTVNLAPGQMKGQKEAVVILAEIKAIQLRYRREQREKRRRSRERRKAAGLPPTTSDEDTSDEELPTNVSLLKSLQGCL